MKWMPMLALSLLIVGCGGDQENLKAWMDEQAKGMKGFVKPLPELKQFPVVAYSVGAAVEPFSVGRIEPERKGGGGLRPDMDRRKEPLEAYPLESLTMVGILVQNQVMHALIRADKSLYQVKVGNYLGQDFGVITDIGDAEIKLTELVEDTDGDWVRRDRSLLLQEQQGDGK